MNDPGFAALRGMILAAGYGRRLLPLTRHLPKPLLPVLDVPLLARAGQAMQAAGITAIAANTHHLADQIASFTRADDYALSLRLHHEAEILGTGGALHGARDFLAGTDSFVLYNGDVLCDLDLRDLVAAHDARTGSDVEATLVLVDWPGVNTVSLAADGRVVGIGADEKSGRSAGTRALTYAGIGVFARSFLERIPPGVSSLVAALRAAMREHPGAVRGIVPAGLQWSDLGTIQRYLDAHAVLLEAAPAGAQEGEAVVWQGAEAEVDPRATLAGWVCVGHRARVPATARLSHCVVLAGTEVPEQTELHRAVIGPGWQVSEDLNAVLGARSVQAAGFGPQTHHEAITGHGSDRRFWRLIIGDSRDSRSTAVAMRSPDDDPEFERFVAIAGFLDELGLGAPRLLAVEPAARVVLMEDLGARSLHDLARAEPSQRGRYYRLVLDRLVDLQVRGSAERDRCPLAADRHFDHATLRWETDYFRTRFLQDHLGLSTDDIESLDTDFETLAQCVLAQPRVLMHRDFQAQNIVIEGDKVGLVDFQGMRLGPICYDLLSLLRDAYVNLGNDLRDVLIEYYRQRLAAAGGPDPGAFRLRGWCVSVGLQRNMQALGAFAFLARVKGKRGFLEHIPLGLEHLRAGLSELRAVNALIASGAEDGGQDCPPRLPALEGIVAGIEI